MSNWHTKSIEHTTEATQTQIITGLSESEAAKRLQEQGPNELSGAKKKSLLRMLLGQLNDALIYVLLGAVLITIFMGEYIDAVIILAVVLLNAILGVIQEYRAGNAIEALQKMAAPKAIVRRSGRQMELAAADLVVGDVVILESGRYVPADLRLIESANLQIDESALTGESVPAEKNAQKIIQDERAALGDRCNMAYMSTLVSYGRGVGVVTGTAQQTEVGKIAHIIANTAENSTPLEKRLAALGKTLGKLAIGICVLMFVVGYIQGRHVAELFLTSVSLAVASIPEGLAAIVAIVLSIGVTKMARQNAIIKKLPAVETLGSVNIICSDKTGTLTQNQMTVQQIFTFGNKEPIRITAGAQYTEEALLLAKGMTLASDASLEGGNAVGDPTELALLMLADDMGIDRAALHQSAPRIDERAFDSNRKMMSTLHETEQGMVVYTKGAIDQLILRCKYVFEEGTIIPLTDTHKDILLMQADNMSEQALRTLALAFKPADKRLPPEQFEQELVMVGIVGMIDPPREEVKAAISAAREAGIRTVMITGDHKNTAFAIARQLGIATEPTEAISGVELDALPPADLEQNAAKYSVFARVNPEHKVNIVNALKSGGNIVAMTGDGVNDAPSLNAADIGVAMGITGTDVAKNAADMVLADDNFTTIVKAVEQGRNIYNNIRKSVIFLLASNLGEVICMLLAIAAGLPAPLLATQLLWINLVTDSLPAIALGLDPGSKEVMQSHPRHPDEHFFSRGGSLVVILGGLSIGLVTLVAYWYGFHAHGYHPTDTQVPENVLRHARTLAFMTIIAGQMFYALSVRHLHQHIFQGGFFKNVYLWGAVILAFFLQLMVLEIPALSDAFKLQSLSISDWCNITLMGMIPPAILELIKLFRKQGGSTWQ